MQPELGSLSVHSWRCCPRACLPRSSRRSTHTEEMVVWWATFRHESLPVSAHERRSIVLPCSACVTHVQCRREPLPGSLPSPHLLRAVWPVVHTVSESMRGDSGCHYEGRETLRRFASCSSAANCSKRRSKLSRSTMILTNSSNDMPATRIGARKMRIAGVCDGSG